MSGCKRHLQRPISSLNDRFRGHRSRHSHRHCLRCVRARRPSKNTVDSAYGAGENRAIPPLKPIVAKCRHPQVRVVARDEDAEFVECQACGDVFDAIEYRDMILEEEESAKDTATD
ncbi:MAG: hypothetical protein HIU93_16765 [Acidobacteria bacterium]|nr:hypothetical protein [Acidobacteriota bacterium]